MKKKEIIFRYDTLCIIDDRYEFQRMHKRSWKTILCGIFNLKLLLTLIPAILFFVFCIPVLERHFNVIVLFPIVSPVIFLSAIDFYEKHRNLIIKRGDIQSMSIKDNTLIILYRKENNKMVNAVKQVELKPEMYTDKELGEMLGYVVQ